MLPPKNVAGLNYADRKEGIIIVRIEEHSAADCKGKHVKKHQL